MNKDSNAPLSKIKEIIDLLESKRGQHCCDKCLLKDIHANLRQFYNQYPKEVSDG